MSELDDFWREQARSVDWIAAPRAVVGSTEPPWTGWFASGTLNTCFNALDRHVVRGAADVTALVAASAAGPAGAAPRELSYAELLGEVAACAGVLRSLGVRPGDPVGPATGASTETVVIVLACARLGATLAPGDGRAGSARPDVVVSSAQGRVVLSAGLAGQAGDGHDGAGEGVVGEWGVLMRAGRTDPAEAAALPAHHPLVSGSPHLPAEHGLLATVAAWAARDDGIASGRRWSPPTTTTSPTTLGESAAPSATWLVRGVLAPLLVGATLDLTRGNDGVLDDDGYRARVEAALRGRRP